MPHDKYDEDAGRVIEELSDVKGLRARGIDKRWIENCAALVEEYRRLEQQARKLEAELSRQEDQSSGDTIVL